MATPVAQAPSLPEHSEERGGRAEIPPPPTSDVGGRGDASMAEVNTTVMGNEEGDQREPHSMAL